LDVNGYSRRIEMEITEKDLWLKAFPRGGIPENFAPVIDDTSFRTVLSLIRKCGCKAFALDVETAFLLESLEEEIYMTMLEWYDPVTKDEKRVPI
jgi:hypothetical protein